MTNRKYMLMLGFGLAAVIQSFAQQKLDSITAFINGQLPIEKIHLHLDKEIYFPGETVWFKAYIITNGNIQAVSKNLFTQLSDINNKNLATFTSPIFDGTSSGQFSLPDSLVSQELVITAVTNQSVSDPNQIIYQKKIYVIGEGSLVAKSAAQQASLQLFAEGGTFINSIANVVAFKATGTNGKPYSVAGAIKDNNDKFIDSIQAVHDGMGSFVFFPAENENYYVAWYDQNRNIQKTPFPKAVSSGIALQIINKPRELIFYLQSPFPIGTIEELCVIATFQNRVIYSAVINMKGKNTIYGEIPITDFPAGIVQVTVFNKDLQPMAERIVFINNKQYGLKTQLEITEKDISKRGKTTIEIKTTDSLRQSLSMSIFDADMSFENEHNILTDLLLKGDLKGNIYRPNQYFNDTSLIMAAHLDLVMQTNGWRRYNWEIGKPGGHNTLLFNDDEYINFAGTVTDADNKIIPGALVTMIIRTMDSASQVLVSAADEDGVFWQDDLIYFDSATLFYTVTKKKAGKQKISITAGSNLQFPTIPDLSVFKHSIDTKHFNNHVQPLKMLVQSAKKTIALDKFEKEAKLLEEVVVKSKIKTPLDLMDEKYAKLYKGSRGGRMFDIINDPAATLSKKPLDYIMTWKVSSRALPPVFYIDEILVSGERLRSLQMDQIAFVKYMPTDFTEPFRSALLFYLKKDEDYQAEYEKKLNTTLSRIKIAGYTPVKEFYRPDYTLSENLKDSRPDYQTTLYWNSNLEINDTKGTIRISFWNNDISKKLKLVLEGFNESGQLIYVEKIIE